MTLDRTTCEETMRHLDELIDGELRAWEVERLEGHLAACVSCRAHFEFERALVERVRAAVRRAEPPVEVRRRIERWLGVLVGAEPPLGA